MYQGWSIYSGKFLMLFVSVFGIIGVCYPAVFVLPQQQTYLGSCPEKEDKTVSSDILTLTQSVWQWVEKRKGHSLRANYLPNKN